MHTQQVDDHRLLIRLHGSFTEDDLVELRSVLPHLQFTRDGSVITIWPPGTHAVTTHTDGAALLQGLFDQAAVDAIRAAYPHQAVTHDGDTVTIWPITVDPNHLMLNGSPE
ncbi:hypothetical protein ACWGI8_05805 [Streptomyces sp. NPDC054841]